MQEALDAYLAEKHVARCAGVPPDVATTYSCDVFKDRIDKIMAQLLEQQAGSSRASSSARPGKSLSGVARREENDGTSVMPAIGWWPEMSKPALIWDLSSPTPPRYSKRDFSAQEYQSSPFNPSLQQIHIVLDDEAGWAFDIKASAAKARTSRTHGSHVITLGSFISDVAEWMQTFQVPWSFWTQAGAVKRRKALRGFERRTGRQFPGNVLENVGRGSLDSFVMSHAHREHVWTIFRGSDLLGDDTMFWGLAVSREPDEWMLKTTHG